MCRRSPGGRHRVASLQQGGKRCILVSSGAIAAGMQRLGWTRQAACDARAAGRGGGRADGPRAVLRDRASASTACVTAQVLLTHADMADRQRYLNARSTSRTLLGLGVIPVINENDTVVTDEIRFGDNDTLGRAGHEPGRSRCARHPDRPGGAVRGRPAPQSRREARRRSASPASRGSRRSREAPEAESRQGRHAHQGARGRSAAARSGAHTVDRFGPRA